MKRRQPRKKQTARKSTRSSIRVRSVITHQEEDLRMEQEELNADELMTDDERTTDENVEPVDTVQADSNVVSSSNQADDNEDTDDGDIEIIENLPTINQELRTFSQATENVSSSQSEFIISIDSEAFLTPPEFIQTKEAQATNQPQMPTSSTSDSTHPQQSTSAIELGGDTITEPSLDEETGWISKETVHAFKYKFVPGKTDKEKIAAFDVDGTLITPKSKNKFSKDINDWKMLDARLVAKIRKHIDEGYAFVIFSNQMGVSRKFLTLNQVKQKFKNIVESIGLPCVALMCTHLDKFRKPAVGMFEFYKTINKTRIDLENSFYVGDAMGRPKDHSAADLLFAHNCKLPFIPIESYLTGFEKPKLFTYEQLKKYRIPKFPDPHGQQVKAPRIIAKGVPRERNEISEFCFIDELITAIDKFVEDNSKSIVIMLIGLFGSGKTTFFEKYLIPYNFKSIGYDPTRSLEDEERQFTNFVQEDEILNKRIVIDQPNLNDKSRKRWLELAKREGYEVFAIHMNLPVEQCLHLVRFRNYYIDTERRAPTQNELLKQSLSLQEPRYDEGFRTIYEVDFFENFNESPLKENIQYYYHFLFDKP